MYAEFIRYDYYTVKLILLKSSFDEYNMLNYLMIE